MAKKAISSASPSFIDNLLISQSCAGMPHVGKHSALHAKHTQSAPEEDASSMRWMSVRALAHRYREVVSEAALRNLIWHAEAYEKSPKAGLVSNGFLPVIVRPPHQRKVLLDRIEFEKWLTSQKDGKASFAAARPNHTNGEPK